MIKVTEKMLQAGIEAANLHGSNITIETIKAIYSSMFAADPANGCTKCPLCGAWSNIKETRRRDEGVYRRYECGNFHWFSTLDENVIRVDEKKPRRGRPNKKPCLISAGHDALLSQ